MNLQKVIRNTVEVIDPSELESLLKASEKTKKPLRIKLGLDPSSPDLHLGHTLVLNKLKDFQDLGHHAILIIGDFTARIGDPTGQNKLRPALSTEEVKHNAQTYCDQAFKVLDPDKTEVVYNSQWLSKLSSEDVVRLCSEMSVARMLERDDFSKRHKGGNPIFIHEFLYPLFQGTDSVVLKNDIELGGTDQKFNLLVGRDLQRARGLKPQQVMMMPLLEGLDGVQKMSKSLGNAVALNDSAKDMFGKIMSISDDLMLRYYKLLSFKDVKIKDLHPMKAKMTLAHEITTRFHSKSAADDAQQYFSQVHQQGSIPQDIEIIPLDQSQYELAQLVHHCGLAPSMKESRRKILEGAVSIDGEKVTDPKKVISVEKTPRTLQLGKRHFKKFCR